MSDQLEQSQQSEDDNNLIDSQEMEDLSEEQIVATILDLGNQIWGNMGFEEPIEDASVFFRDQFYMQFFMSAFPDSDFSQLVETDDEEVMGANIQALIDMLSQKILMYDLEHIKGEQIVAGNPEHCINLLQLAKEISCMMNSNSNELDPNQMQDDEDDNSQPEDIEGQADLFNMQQQLELEQHGKDSDSDNQQPDSSDNSQRQDQMQRMAQADSSDQSQEPGDNQESGVVDYDQIQVELDDDIDIEDGGHEQSDGNRGQSGSEGDNDEGEQEVSINLEDAIATAEEINKHDQYDGQEDSDQDPNMDDSGMIVDEDGNPVYLGDVDSKLIAGIVTDGHNEKDGFDQMREEQLHRQRMARDEYGQEGEDGHNDDDESGVYDEEDDIDQEGLEQAVALHQQQPQDDSDDEQQEDGEGDDDEDGEGMQMQIHPDLIAAAHKMGVDLDDEQIHELQKFIEQQNIDLDAEESEEELDSQLQQQMNEQAGHNDSQMSSNNSRRNEDKQGNQQMRGGSSSSQSDDRQGGRSGNKSGKKQKMHDEEDQEAYQYLQQQQQYENEKERDEDEDDDEAHPDDGDENPDELQDDEQQEGDADEEEEDNGEGEGDDKMQFDVDELDERERELLVAYLQEEYEKSPNEFPIPKEKLQELINAQLNRRDGYDEEDEGEDANDGQEQDDAEENEMQELTEEQQQQLLMLQAAQMQQQQQAENEGQVMDGEEQDSDQEDIEGQGEDQELEIEGGGQQIEEDDFPTEQEMIDQQLTQEQIQQVLLLKQQQQQQQQMQMQMQQEHDGDQSYGQEGEDVRQDGAMLNTEDMMEEQMDDGQQHQMHQIYVQKQLGKKRKVGAKTMAANNQMSKYSAVRGKKGLVSAQMRMANTAESVGQENPLQRLMQAPPKNKPSARQQTGKKPRVSQQRPQTAKPRQPAQSYKQFIASQSNRAGRTQRNTQQVQSASAQQFRPFRKQSAKKQRSGPKKQLNTISHAPQDDQAILLQQLIAQKQENGVMPVFNEEFLSQLSEEQLQQVIQQQQALIQQNPNRPMSSKSASLLPPRPKRSRSAKRPQSSGVMVGASEGQPRNNARTRAHIYSQNIPTISSGRRRTSKPSSANREKKASKGKRRKVQPGQGILLNNFFPALESGGHHQVQKHSAEDQFAAQQALLAQQEAQQHQQIINEVPPEEEEGESQDIVNSRIQHSSTMQEQVQLQQQTMQLVQALESLDPEQQQQFLEQLTPEQQEQLLIHHQQMQQMQQQEGQQMFAVDEHGQQIALSAGQQMDGVYGEQETGDMAQMEDHGQGSPDIELTEEQLVELLKNADQLSQEQQAQLQQILKKRWKKEIKSQKEKQYNNIYNILTENVAKAKVRLAKLADSPSKKNSKQQAEDRETIERINRQKKEYETLLKAYSHEQKARNKGKELEQKRIEKQIQREIKLKQIREKKFEEELINQQKSLMYKRNAQQVRLCQKVYRLASNLEKSKLLEEKKNFIENQTMKKTQKKQMVDCIENFYRDKINMLRERIETEKFERKIAQNAQVEALSRMKRELDLGKKKEIQKYLALLKQEDQKYDFQSSNLQKLEQEIVRLYKK